MKSFHVSRESWRKKYEKRKYIDRLKCLLSVEDEILAEEGTRNKKYLDYNCCYVYKFKSLHYAK